MPHANYVYPLDNRDVRRSLTMPPFREARCAAPRTFYPGSTAALASSRRSSPTAITELDCGSRHAGDDAGVVFALGDPLAGMALFARGGALAFVYHGGNGRPVMCDGLPLRSASESLRVAAPRAR